MLGGKGYFRGSSVLVSGTAGTGKSSVAASFVEATCRRGEKCLYFALEEPSAQVIRNMRSIGLDLAPRVTERTLRIASARPTVFGLEQHLVTMHAAIERFRPRVVVVDPIALANVTAICERHLKGRYELAVVDVYQQPALAKAEEVIAIPTLVKREPGPVKRLIGDLSDQKRVLAGLGIGEAHEEER